MKLNFFCPQVDCDQYGDTVCDANGITGYPTMIWFKNGERVRNKRKMDFFGNGESCRGGGLIATSMVILCVMQTELLAILV